ncbi:MAG: hypothetical protein LUD78_11595, partial [Clostridiales bacterium]|nr:hypothetical protein [Clostridiales bacterium]
HPHPGQQQRGAGKRILLFVHAATPIQKQKYARPAGNMLLTKLGHPISQNPLTSGQGDGKLKVTYAVPLNRLCL